MDRAAEAWWSDEVLPAEFVTFRDAAAHLRAPSAAWVLLVNRRRRRATPNRAVGVDRASLERTAAWCAGRGSGRVRSLLRAIHRAFQPPALVEHAAVPQTVSRT